MDYPLANVGGITSPLSAIGAILSTTVPESLNQFQQLNAATISGVSTIKRDKLGTPATHRLGTMDSRSRSS
jgi:hypothetical protein